MKKKKSFNQKGLTLTELLVVLGIAFVLSLVFVIGINPSRQFQLARDNQRKAEVNLLHTLFMEYASRNDGDFPDCGVGGLSSEPIDIYNCQELIDEDYIEEFPYDPDLGCVEAFYGYQFSSETGYQVKKNVSGRIGVRAVCSEIEAEIIAGDWGLIF